MTTPPDDEALKDEALKAALGDLAFMRGLTRTRPEVQIATGQTFVAAGLIYGLQCLFHWAQHLGWAPEGAVSLVIVLGFTVAFAVAMFVLIRRGNARVAAAGGGQGSTGRTGGAVFGALGLTNLVILASIAIVAVRENSLTVWLIYPTVVMALQGAGWLAFFMLRRSGWMLATAFAYFACALGMAWFNNQAEGFLAVVTFALLVVMTGSGLMLIRQARRGV